ncbi:uncharacterized protein [Battus philenor]|uniref:uncharacterized protein n=1 Tax=Battus philenor TaxID=42288 RepID=UPI0035D0C607
METIASRTDLDTKHLTERYAEYTAPMHDQHLFYTYEPSPPHTSSIPTKYHYPSSGHKGNAAMSALTLLAFLFFLHILQQCLKDHMTAMGTPQIMIMTAGKEGEENIAKSSPKNKIDKTGIVNDENYFKTPISVTEKNKFSGDKSELESVNSGGSSPKHLLKIKTEEHKPENVVPKNKIMKNHQNSSVIANFYEKFYN